MAVSGYATSKTRNIPSASIAYRPTSSATCDKMTDKSGKRTSSVPCTKETEKCKAHCGS